MPDGTVVAPQVYTIVPGAPPDRGANKFLPADNKWIALPDMPENLITPDGEIGPGVTLPNGKAFFVGGTQATALYTSGAAPGDPGTWTAGPPLLTDPHGGLLGARDAPCCLMPNGHVLFTASPYGTQISDHQGPTYFFEFDGTYIRRAPAPPTNAAHCSVGRMLLLPTGEVAYVAGGPDIYLYSPAPEFQESWRPTIDFCPTILKSGQTYTLMGRQLNGLSQAVGYGDDSAAATNYPLVRVTLKSNFTPGAPLVYYCRTFGHSSMAIATGQLVQATNFTVPDLPPLPATTLEVVVNGIPSLPIQVTHSYEEYP